MVAIAFEDGGLNPFDDEFAFEGARLLLVLWRHDMGVEVLHDLFPDVLVFGDALFVFVGVKGYAALFLAVAVAAVAVLAQEGRNILLEREFGLVGTRHGEAVEQLRGPAEAIYRGKQPGQQSKRYGASELHNHPIDVS